MRKLVRDREPFSDARPESLRAPPHGRPSDKWVTIKGKIVWDSAKGAVPKRAPIKATKDEEVRRQGQGLPDGRLGRQPEDWRHQARRRLAHAGAGRRPKCALSKSAEGRQVVCLQVVHGG